MLLCFCSLSLVTWWGGDHCPKGCVKRDYSVVVLAVSGAWESCILDYSSANKRYCESWVCRWWGKSKCTEGIEKRKKGGWEKNKLHPGEHDLHNDNLPSVKRWEYTVWMFYWINSMPVRCRVFQINWVLTFFKFDSLTSKVWFTLKVAERSTQHVSKKWSKTHNCFFLTMCLHNEPLIGPWKCLRFSQELQRNML